MADEKDRELDEKARLQPITKPQAIVTRLVEYLESSSFAPGDKLPTEKDLVELLSVGRSSLREAIRKLEAMGIVEVRHGTGTFLARAPSRAEVMVPLVIAAERASLLQALEIRRALECRAAVLAATHASPEQVENIRLALDEMERVHKEKGAAMEEDLRFHLAVYEASGNPLFAKIINPVRGPFRVFFSQSVVGRKGFGSSSFPQHRELYEAIAARDPVASERTTINLLQHVEDEIRAHSFP